MIRNSTRRFIPKISVLPVANQERGFANTRTSPGARDINDVKKHPQPSAPSQTSSSASSTKTSESAARTTANPDSDVNVDMKVAKEEEKKSIGGSKKKKSMAELDEEMRAKLDGISGEGGGAGVEYEGGKAVGLKRGVRENMFRVI
ncbi:hypothetical protein LHYA1_G006893 [Lachnellula hyalina]|uniref:Uncharacterized protein n=1 Tax=Lachnellula hyalina TaxID=1316788 RepID=A0A8H8QXE6_9HELO|nr:uncharacterized protein LHYA1_G006893 [Lachnellula hyalina]TVY24518.1 hypothetical protein LHYA1_G006893 [Lachnellula hyalina]